MQDIYLDRSRPSRVWPIKNYVHYTPNSLGSTTCHHLIALSLLGTLMDNSGTSNAGSLVPSVPATDLGIPLGALLASASSVQPTLPRSPPAPWPSLSVLPSQFLLQCSDLAPGYTRTWSGGYWTLPTTCATHTVTSLPWYLVPSPLHSPILAPTSDWLALVPLGPCLAHLGHSTSLGLQPIGRRLPYQAIAPCSPWSFPIRSCPFSPPVPPFPFDPPVPSTSVMLCSILYALL
jgi:hypothetical protein